MTRNAPLSVDPKTQSGRKALSLGSVGGRLMLAAVAAAVILGLLAVPQAPGRAEGTPVPPPGISLPAALDWIPEYHGQTLCSPIAKPGVLQLGALLDRTYGVYTKGYVRSCPGNLEHQEGRALDWMVNSQDPTQRAAGDAFVNWLTAPGPNGEPAANARRLGILYIIWNNQIWGTYRHADGWREYSGCGAPDNTRKGNATSCHRDHVHITMTWDGANAQTSFWSGSAEVRTPCPTSTVVRNKVGTAASPATLMNTKTGVGLSGKGCRLTGNTRYTSRTYTVKVPVPTTTDGSVPVQRIRVSAFDLNAPTVLNIASAGTVTVPQGAALPLELEVPLSSDGAITMSLAGGHAGLKLQTVGYGAGAVGAPAVQNASLSRARAKSPVMKRSQTKIKASIAGASAGSSLVVRRKIAKRKWKDIHTQPAVDGRFKQQLGVKAAKPHKFQVRMFDASGTRVAKSRRMRVQVYR